MAVTEQIALDGCDPGARECLTTEALSAISDAEVVIGSMRLLSLFPDLKAERAVVRGYREEAIEAIKLHQDKRIALLVTGDPGLASLATAVIEYFGIEACRVLPGISSVQTAFARVGLSWEGARIISAHASEPRCNFDSLATEQRIAVLTGNAESVQWIASLAHRLGKEWRIVVAQDLTLENERIIEINASELEQLPKPLRAVILFLRKSEA